MINLTINGRPCTASDGATILEAARRTFRPEFLNRVDDIVVFRSLTREELLSVVGIMASEVTKRAAEQDLGLDLEEGVLQHILDKGFDPKYGARPLRRTLQRLVEDRLADLLLEGTLQRGDRVRVTPEEGELQFRKAPREEAPDPA